jgi:hypothetical protein
MENQQQWRIYRSPSLVVFSHYSDLVKFGHPATGQVMNADDKGRIYGRTDRR